MSLIKARKIATLDAEAKDIKLPFIITFNNGKKEFREGYSEEEVRRRFDKSVAALYGGIKSVKLEGEDKRNGKDSAATDFGEEENVALEKIAKEYDRKLQSALADLKAFRMKASRYDPTCSYEIEEAIKNLTIVSKWCNYGAVYGFEA